MADRAYEAKDMDRWLEAAIEITKKAGAVRFSIYIIIYSHSHDNTPPPGSSVNCPWWSYIHKL